MMRRCIVTPEGPRYVDMTADEVAERQAEEAEARRVKPEQIKAEARRRILGRYPDFKQWNAPRGTRGSETMWAWIDAVRAASNLLEAMAPIPADYADDKWWIIP